jgi:hypothetical protein
MSLWALLNFYFFLKVGVGQTKVWMPTFLFAEISQSYTTLLRLFGRAPCTFDQPDSKPLPTLTEQYSRGQTPMPLVGIKPLSQCSSGQDPFLMQCEVLFLK